jgi:hypothetical protein
MISTKKRFGILAGTVMGVMALTGISANAFGETVEERLPLKRFPDIHENTIVFVHGEDIWKVGVEGGTAIRLTVQDGEECFPKFSPDGKWIAFTGDYDGNSDIYVMNRDGGQIKRITYHPGYDQVVGWHPKKNKIMFSSNRHSFNRFSRLFLISPDGSGLEKLMLHEAAFGSFSPDGTRIAYNKVAREHRTWKRYLGGLVGVSTTIRMIDGGSLTAPDYRVYDTKGNWMIENEGVTPDIIIDNTPEEMARGYDAQLMTGIEYLLKKIKENPRPWPQHPPFPRDKQAKTE